MATSYHIQELRDGLLVQVKYEIPLWERVLGAALAGATVGWVSFQFLGGRWWVTLSVVAVVASFVAAVRTKRAELRTTNVEFITRGNFGKRFRSGQTVCTGDVRWLEYRDESAGSDLPHRSSGLYAVKVRGDACLMPFLNEQEAIQIIGEIEKHFPGLAERWREESPFNHHFLTLDLAKTK